MEYNGEKKTRNSKTAKKWKIKQTANNPFTANTGVKAYQLTGSSDCLICPQKEAKNVSTRKIAFALANGWQSYEMGFDSKRIKLLSVKATCGVDQCINPAHLVGTEKEDNAATNGWG
jgi:hypothetical protein